MSSWRQFDFKNWAASLDRFCRRRSVCYRQWGHVADNLVHTICTRHRMVHYYVLWLWVPVPAVVSGGPHVCQTSTNGRNQWFLSLPENPRRTALLTSIFETRFTQILRGKIPDELVNQGLGLADNHLQHPRYSDTILDAMIKAYHDGSVPGILLGALYAVAVACLQNIDFVPAWKRARIAAKIAFMEER
jgi:hypothetical protein